jgi:hypothetical protein
VGIALGDALNTGLAIKVDDGFTLRMLEALQARKSRGKPGLSKYLILLVGARGFEPPTTCTPSCVTPVSEKDKEFSTKP